MAVSEEAERQNMERSMAEHPFRVASMVARHAEMRAEGFVFEGCDPHEGPSEMSAAEVRAVVERVERSREHGPEGPCFVGCGHRVSDSQRKREGF